MLYDDIITALCSIVALSYKIHDKLDISVKLIQNTLCHTDILHKDSARIQSPAGLLLTRFLLHPLPHLAIAYEFVALAIFSPIRKVKYNTTMPPLPIKHQVTRLLKTQQFYWFLGHVLAILFFVLHFVTSFFNPASSLKYFRFSLLSILLTYTLVIKQIYSRKNFTVNKLIRDENVQYLTLALVLYLASFSIGPVPSSLYSFVIFGTFHVLSYFQNNLLQFVPKLATQQRLNSLINLFTESLNSQAMGTAALGEIVLLGLIGMQLPGALFLDLLFKRKYIAVLTKFGVFGFVLVFDKLRYDLSEYTKAIVRQFDTQAGGLLAKLGNPKVTELYASFKREVFGKYLLKIKLPAAEKAKEAKR